MTYKEAGFDSLKCIHGGQWMTVLKIEEPPAYLNLPMEGIQASAVVKGLTPGTGFRWIYEQYLPDQQLEDYQVESLTIYRSGETIKGSIIFQGETTIERELQIEGALALALKRRGRIMVDSDLLRK